MDTWDAGFRASDGAGENNAAILPRLHVGQHSLHSNEGAPKIQVHNFIPVGKGHRLHSRLTFSYCEPGVVIKEKKTSGNMPAF